MNEWLAHLCNPQTKITTVAGPEGGYATINQNALNTYCGSFSMCVWGGGEGMEIFITMEHFYLTPHPPP